jgi:AraC-like DNA-binding protein
MPYTRSILADTPLLTWHELTLLAPVPQWSVPYRAPTPRLMIPASRWVEVERGGCRFVCDALSPLWLRPDQDYRLRQPWPGQRSLVLLWHAELAVGADPRPRLTPAMQLALARWSARLRRADIDPLALEEALCGLLHGLLSTPPDECAGPRAAAMQRAVERVRERLAADPGRSDSLADLARGAHSSPFHLARAFRRRTGRSLHGYRTALRMGLALQRLHDGERNLSALAADLGYASHSHFSASFRRWFGCAPAQLRTDLTAPAPR